MWYILFGVCVIVGSESVLAYITTMGKIFGWDLRSQEVAWKLSTMPKYGKYIICTDRVDGIS